MTIVYCARRAADVTELLLPAGATVADAIDASGVRERHRGLDLADQVGIWGRLCQLQDPVADGDRVEIYRRLTVDPKEARRRRAEVRKRRG